MIWFVAGFFVGFGDVLFQLVINTFTTVVTFLMVFLIQATQNRDAKAIHRKLDELILAVDKACNQAVGIEVRTEAEIEAIADRQRREAGMEES